MISHPRLTSFEREGLTFDVIDSGPAGGAPVVLLHGFPQRASCWQLVSEHLHQAGLRTYAVDQRGYSPGARPRSRHAYGLRALRADVLALIEAIGRGPVHLVGHDWGAAVAWSVAGVAPEQVRSLTAVSVPHPSAFLRSLLTSSQGLHSSYMLAFQIPMLPEWVLTRWPERLLPRFGMSRPMIEVFRREMLDGGALRGGLGYYRSLVRLRPGDLGPVAVPTTYVWSDRDVALVRKGASTTGRWVTGPYAFEVLTGVSHWILDERPGELAALIARQVEQAG